jgi:ribonuclease T2
MTRIIATLFLVLLALPVRAEVPLGGTFTATMACPAYQSISRKTNPGAVMTEPGKAYELIAGNKAAPSHFWIAIPGAEPERRWVAVACGTSDDAAETPLAASAPSPAYRGTQYILAVNWQPAFCETSPYKPECRTQLADSFEATHFTLHGLWPQPRGNEYCNVSPRDRQASTLGDWRDLPALDLSPGLRRDLDEAMPGTQSRLERHEWTRHGTCYGTTAEEYYSDALDLLLALNTSAVAELFAGNIGRKITLAQIRQAFDAAFGPGAGARVHMDCEPDGNRTIITELTISLTGEITGPDDFAALIAAADPADDGCRSGMVDPVGLR